MIRGLSEILFNLRCVYDIFCHFSGYCGPEERREADSGVATDSGDRNDRVSTTASVLSNVSASVSLDNLYLGEEAELADSDQSNR